MDRVHDLNSPYRILSKHRLGCVLMKNKTGQVTENRIQQRLRRIRASYEQPTHWDHGTAGATLVPARPEEQGTGAFP